MKIYVEQVIFTNFIIDACILIMISKLIFSKISFKRISLSAAFGSSSSLIMPLCSNLILSNVLKVITAVIMLQILNVKTKKHLILSSILMLTLSYIIGGAILSTFGTQTNNGYLLSGLGLIPVFATTLIFTFITCKLISYLKSKMISNSHIYTTTLIYKSSQLTIKGFIDSGNGLYDNTTPVSLINFETFTKLTKISLEQYLNNQFNDLINPHFIEANTIAGKRKILVFTIDELRLITNEHKVYKNVSLGVSLNFDNNQEYKAILNSSFCLI